MAYSSRALTRGGEDYGVRITRKSVVKHETPWSDDEAIASGRNILRICGPCNADALLFAMGTGVESTDPYAAVNPYASRTGYFAAYRAGRRPGGEK